jgi:Domain of unknown function (DUF1330)
MVRAFVLYEGEPEAERYRQHNEEFSSKIPATFRHGKVFGTAFGDQKYRYYAEFEFPDMESFKAAASSPEFAAAGKDAAAMGIPFSVYFTEVE